MRNKRQNLKKKFKTIINPEKGQDLYFFDESRFGTHSKIGHGWFKKGERTEVAVKLGFENFYVYSAVNPVTGEDFTLMIPNVNTACMNVFLEEMSKSLNKKAILIMDCASWHKSKDLKVADNIHIMYLPAYSPELNPVERLWQHMKSNILKNKIYETIDDLKEAVCAFIKNLSKEILQSLCSVNY